ncbi:unnamed protein product [Linum tenue]|uniref:Complex I assembly factor TIMMDC1, mitochondrial n=1 Tax=Linum tenue TaxID=586396 RepID=A0AAV0IM74_9ROSI|nr:unnamed protein product [Linum tenue]
MEASNTAEHEKPWNSGKLPGTVSWSTASIIGFFTGMIYGGAKEASASASIDADVMLKLGSTPNKAKQYNLMRDAMERRFVKVSRGALVGGVRLGMFTAAFCGLQNLMAEHRGGVHDVYNVVGAGSVTAATFGLILPGSLRWRARNVLLGSVLGVVVCFPLGWVQMKLVEKANEDGGNSKRGGADGGGGGVEAAIERLEARVKR